jgi:hypothetical protein
MRNLEKESLEENLLDPRCCLGWALLIYASFRPAYIVTTELPSQLTG